MKTLAEYADIVDVYMTDGQLASGPWAVSRLPRAETVTNAFEYTLRRKDTDDLVPTVPDARVSAKDDSRPRRAVVR